MDTCRGLNVPVNEEACKAAVRYVDANGGCVYKQCENPAREFCKSHAKQARKYVPINSADKIVLAPFPTYLQAIGERMLTAFNQIQSEFVAELRRKIQKVSEEAKRTQEALKAELEEARVARNQERQSFAGDAAKLAAVQVQCDELVKKDEARSKQIADLETKLSQKQAVAEQADAKTAELTLLRSDTSRQLEEVQKSIRDLKAELAAKNEQLKREEKKSGEEKDQLVKERDALKQELKEAMGTKESTSANLSAITQALEESKREQETLQRRIGKYEADLSAANSVSEKQSVRIKDLEAQLESLRAEVASKEASLRAAQQSWRIFQVRLRKPKSPSGHFRPPTRN
jgi:chromosome segregation ATPase